MTFVLQCRLYTKRSKTVKNASLDTNKELSENIKNFIKIKTREGFGIL